jgi:hypothetical protein
MWINLLISVVSALGGLALWLRREPSHLLILGCGILFVWQIYSALSDPRKRGRVILRIGGFAWTMENSAAAG